MSESKLPRGKYKTTNWASYNASLKARGSLTVWLDKGMQWYAPATGKRGRQPIFSDAASKNARAWKNNQTGAASRNEALLACQRLGRRIWKKWIGYYRRSQVETKMNCFKRLGERVMARTFECQVTELHIRVALLNRFSQLGRPVTVAVA